MGVQELVLEITEVLTAREYGVDGVNFLAYKR